MVRICRKVWVDTLFCYGLLFSVLVTSGWSQVESPKVASQLAGEAYQNGEFTSAGSLFVEAAFAEGADRKGWLYNAACSFALAGQSELAIRYLQLAFESGFRNLSWMLQDPDLESLHGRIGWKSTVARIEAEVERTRDPERVRLVTSDIERFWETMDLIESQESEIGVPELIEELYFGRGSVGLRDFVTLRIESAERLQTAVTEYSKYYRSIRHNTLEVKSKEGEIRRAMRRIQELVPSASFPDVFFVIGRFSSAGTVSSNGLLIGVEMLSTDKETPLDELPAWRRRVARSSSVLPWVVTHELVHSLQERPPESTLLAGAIREGGADFLAEIAAGPPLPLPYYRGFVDQHEVEVWSEFVAAMDGSDISRWLGNNSRGTEEWPADLGYEIGYRISKAFFQQSEDKQEAVATLLKLKDPRWILEKSGYVGRSMPDRLSSSTDR